MSFGVFIEYEGYLPAMPLRDENAILRESFTEVGEHFLKVNMLWRFLEFGARMLGWRQRSPRYNARKQRLFGHQLPLVWSGVTRDRALSEQFTRVVAKATGGVGSTVLRVNVPALNFKHPKGPNTREEFERVAAREIGPLERVVEKSATKHLNNYNARSSFKA